MMVKRNPYALSMRDMYWIYANVYRYKRPRSFIRGLLRQQHSEISQQRFGSDQELAQACIKIATQCERTFQHDEDHSLWEALVSSDYDGAPTRTIQLFSDLWRGYSENELQDTIPTIQTDRDELLDLLSQTKTKNLKLLNDAQKQGNAIRQQAYGLNGKKLEEIEKSIKKAFNSDTTALAHRKLRFRVQRRRGSFAYRVLTRSPNDYFFFEEQLHRYDPHLLSFPLRHLTWLLFGEYKEMEQKWLGGVSRDEIILSLEGDDTSSGTGLREDLEEFNSDLADTFGFDRSIALGELETAYQNGCFLAATLLAVTQTEGILWDFARYLNRKNIRIYKTSHHHKPKHYAYHWDRQCGKYKKLNSQTKRPTFDRRCNLTSARHLLQTTRMGSIIPAELYSVLVDEFYDDRNVLAHGDIKGRNLKVDAISSVLCLYTCMYQITRYLSKGVLG